MCRTTTPPPVPPIPNNNYKEGKMDMEENKKMATAEGSIQQQPIQLTVEITNLHELEQLIIDINEELTQLKNFKLQVDTIK